MRLSSPLLGCNAGVSTPCSSRLGVTLRRNRFIHPYFQPKTLQIVLTGDTGIVTTYNGGFVADTGSIKVTPFQLGTNSFDRAMC